MKSSHVGLVKIQGNRIVHVRYYESKFERNLGDSITYEGVNFKVAFVGESRNEVIEALNEVIRQQNAIVRREQKVINAKNTSSNRQVNSYFANLLNEVLRDINNTKAF